MILLPDIIIRVGGANNILSLQDPYTLNGKLITNICFETEPEDVYATNLFGERVATLRSSVNNSIHIRNEEDYNIRISENDLSLLIHNVLSSFFEEHNANEVRVGESRYSWVIRRSYSISNYIRDLMEQCTRISNSYSLTYYDTNFISRCRQRLIAQGRLENTNRDWYNGNWYYYNSTTSSRPSNVFAEGNYMGAYGQSVINPAINTVINLNSSESSAQKKYIHEFNYKPEYIKHYMPDEDSSSLLLGAEIEVAGNTRTDLNKEDVVKKCIQIMNGSDDDTEDLIYSTSDSTVQIELDTMPCTLDYHKQMNYKELFKYLDELGYKGHDCDTAGLHVHADRSYLGKSELKQQLVITKILYILEKFNDEICVIARRNNDYSRFVGKEEVNKTLDALYGKYKNYGKKVALNLQHEGTIEFRCFRSTLRYETFILTLEFVKNIIDYAKRVNIEEIELIQWSDLMDTFSDELKEYYNDRLEKENKKKKEEKKENKRNISLGSGNLYFSYPDGERFAIGSVGSLGLDTVTTTVSEGVSYNADGMIGRLNDCSATMSCTINSASSSFSSLIDAVCGSNNSSSIASIRDEIETRIENISEIERQKKEIKTLKKRIKNSRSYMEKAQLNAELSQAQKELKKLKKRERNNLNNNSDNINNTSNNTTTCTSTVADSNRITYTDDCWSARRWFY